LGSFALSWSPRNLSSFFLLTLVFAGGLVCLAGAAPKSPTASDGPYQLNLFHTHTGERLNIVYRNGEGYDQESLARLNHYLRDHRTGEVHEYDPRVFDLLHDLMTSLGNPNLEIDVVCGYRTPWSNEFLRTHGHGVALHSLHMQAMAGCCVGAASRRRRLLRSFGLRARRCGSRPALVAGPEITDTDIP
jgi:uncharacterized protein YcbK (DUF882 family)